MKLKRVIVTVLMAAICAAGFTGCKSDTVGGKDRITVTMWTDDSSSMNVMKDLVNEFNGGIGKEKNIYFDYQIKENDLAKQVEVALVTDQAPDLFAGPSILKLVENEEIACLDDYSELAELREEYPLRRKGWTTVNDKLYSLAINLGEYALIYNKDMFRAAGIVDENGEPTPPKTFDEVREYAKKLTDTSKQQYGIVFPIKWGGMYSCDIMNASQSSAGYIGYNPVKGEYDFEYIRPMLEMVLGIKDDKSNYPGAEGLDNDPARARFAEGNIGMKFAVSWDVGVFNDQFPAKCDWGVAPLPVADANKRYKQIETCGTTAYINANSMKDEKKKAAVLEVYKWLYGDDVITTLYKEGIALPNNSNIIENTEISENRKGWKEFAQMHSIAHIQAEGPSVDVSGYEARGEVFTSQVWTGKMSIDEFIKESTKIYNEGVKKYAETHPDYNPKQYINPDWDISLQ